MKKIIEATIATFVYWGVISLVVLNTNVYTWHWSARLVFILGVLYQLNKLTDPKAQIGIYVLKLNSERRAYSSNK